MRQVVLTVGVLLAATPRTRRTSVMADATRSA
jgi:hypothetical protein